MFPMRGRGRTRGTFFQSNTDAQLHSAADTGGTGTPSDGVASLAGLVAWIGAIGIAGRSAEIWADATWAEAQPPNPNAAATAPARTAPRGKGNILVPQNKRR